MTFDPRSREHLQKLIRQLPRELPKPKPPLEQKESRTNDTSHPIETTNNPQLLFQELMNASPDGNVPTHLIQRLKEIETKELGHNHQSNKTTNTSSEAKQIAPKKKSKKETKEEILYSSFNRFLLEEED
ncbi:hypothetical protein [Prochlorococcus sp. MIT 1307]|uniref:hypothetical protein n=1 Tax=Prochlorococcus sp. MIT 1307 TaxID=3096219 RepID=UPI002A7618D6|nr:hypothetical protein [Prochlorococcus sp. MIT 1307]